MSFCEFFGFIYRRYFKQGGNDYFMMTIIYNEDIALSNANAIVNASNGWGYMGGQRCVNTKQDGVAESIQYISKGTVERISKQICKKKLFGFAPGSIFITAAPNMKADYIIHAVTMRTPGSRAKIKTIKTLVPKIVKLSEQMKFKQVAIPLLGTGTGGLPLKDVYSIFEDLLLDSFVEFLLYTNYRF